ncbi:MAG: ABC transporter substrate-binding protein [Bacillota bacterium]
MQLKKVFTAIAVMILALALALAGCGKTSQPSGQGAAPKESKEAGDTGQYTVKWTYRLTPQNIVFFDGKFGEKYGVNVKQISLPTGTEARDALLSGEVDVAELGVTPALTALAKAPNDLAIIGASSFGGGKYRVVVKKDSAIQSMDQLVGKKIAVKVGSGCYTAFLMWTKQKGYDIKQFNCADMGDTDAMAALESNSVDAVVYWEPIPSILVAKGLAREIFNFDGFVENPVYLVASRKWLEQNPEAAKRLMAAWIETDHQIMFKPAEAAKISSEALSKKGINISAEAYKSAFMHERFEPWIYPALVEETKQTFQYLKENNKITGEIDWAKAYQTQYLADAYQLVMKKNLEQK